MCMSLWATSISRRAAKRQTTLFVGGLMTAVLVMGLALPALAADPLDTWTARSPGVSTCLNGITYGDNTFVTVGLDGTVLTSPDGTSWTSRTSGTKNDLNAIAYGGGKFITVGWKGTILTSTNAEAWTSQFTGVSDFLLGVSYGSGTFVAVGGNSSPKSTILTSGDGVIWTNRTSGTSNCLNGVTFANGTFVAVGNGGLILTSTDGATWTSRVSGTGNDLYDITYGNGTFVAVGWQTILTSKNGVTWTSHAPGPSYFLHSAAYGNGMFVIAEDSTILASSDGTTWGTHNSGKTAALYGMTYGNGTFVAVGGYSTILQSDSVLGPAAPSNLTSTIVAPDIVELNWNDNSDNEDGFKVERKTGSGSYTQIDTSPMDWPKRSDTGLAAGKTYTYRVCAYNASGNSSYSNEVTVTTAGETTTPPGGTTTPPGGTATPPGGTGTPTAGAGPGATQTTIELRVDDIFYSVNGQGKEMDAPPVAINGRTLLPIRYVAEPLGASVGWNAGEQKATVTLGSRVIELWIGNNRAVVDGVETQIDASNPDVVPMVLPPGRTMLPLRFVAEALGCDVGWDGLTKTVTVTSGGTASSSGTTSTVTEAWTATWQSDFGPLKLKQQGNQVTGTYDTYDSATINGTVTGDILVGTWTEWGGTTGDLEFTLSADGKSFTGQWRYAGESDTAWKQWNGTK